MIKKIFVLVFFISFSFSETFPYCDFEATSEIKAIEIADLMTDETKKVIEKHAELIAKQKELMKALSKKEGSLMRIRAILSQILLMKKRENFELEKLIQLNQY